MKNITLDRYFLTTIAYITSPTVLTAMDKLDMSVYVSLITLLIGYTFGIKRGESKAKEDYYNVK